MPLDNELTQVSVGQPFMEFLPIMINKVGVVIALEVICGMPVLSVIQFHFNMLVVSLS